VFSVYLTIMQNEMSQPNRPQPNERCGDMLSCHRVKIFADGSLGAETAALSQPYLSLPSHQNCNNNHNHQSSQSSSSSSSTTTKKDEKNQSEDRSCGVLIHEQTVLNSMVSAAHQKGFRVEMHVIGDRAAEIGLNAFDAAGMTAKDRP